MSSVLKVEALNKSYGSLAVTRNVSLTVEPGERHVIIGPNGAGKTSLIHQIGGQLKPSSGRIFLKGAEITGLAPERICRLGLGRTFQKNNLFQNLSVRENVRLAIQARHGTLSELLVPIVRLSRQRDRAEALLAQVHLTGRADALVRNLSYGEQRQLEIAVALAGDPELLLLDEPTSGMSPAETDRIIALVAELPRSLSILMIEHDMKVVFSLADRLTVLYYGEVLATGKPEEIRLNQRVREVYLGIDEGDGHAGA